MKLRVFTNFLLLALFVLLSTGQALSAGVPMPFRIGGTLTIDGVQKLQADTGIVVKVTKPDGTAYADASGNPPKSTNLNANNWYIINVPIYDATVQTGGAQTNESAMIQVVLNGTELFVTTPSGGSLTVGASGSTQQIDIVAASSVNGTCGAASSQTFTIAPATNLCTTGTDSAVIGSGPWNWTCAGLNGGSTANCTANINTYTVTPSAGPNGSISPATQQTANSGSNLSFTVTPSIGYQIATVTGCGGTLTGSTYTTGPISGDCTVSASFSAIPETATHTGDINADGTVTISDALMALRIAVGLIPMDAKYLADGDVSPYVNNKPQPDGNINISDALVILRKCVGLINW